MKYKITIEGQKVHDVGYRPFLISLANDFDIQRFAVKNAVVEDKQVVIAKIEAEEAQFNEFMDAVRVERPQKAEVSSITYEAFEGQVPSIIKTSMLNMNAQLAKGIAAMGTMIEKRDIAAKEIRGLRQDLAENTNARLERV